MGDNHTIAHMTSSLAMAIPLFLRSRDITLEFARLGRTKMSGDINDQVANLLLEASTSGPGATAADLDILEMPSKVWPRFGCRSKTKWTPKSQTFLVDEARHTKEPYIKFSWNSRLLVHAGTLRAFGPDS